MSFVAVAIGASAVLGYMGSQNAANTQSNAASNATNAQVSMFNQQEQDTAPWRQAGATALSQMANPDFQKSFTSSDFQEDPGYQYRMQQGQQAIERAAAAHGGANTGDTLKALTNFNQNQASNEYQNAYNRFTNDQSTRFNRLASIAGTGQTANGEIMNAGTNTANQIGQNTISAGNAAAAGQMGATNAISNGLTTGANTWMNMSMMNRLFPQTATPTAPAQEREQFTYA